MTAYNYIKMESCKEKKLCVENFNIMIIRFCEICVQILNYYRGAFVITIQFDL